MLLCGPPTIVMPKVPLAVKVLGAVGFKINSGIGASENNAAQVARPPTSIVRLPDSIPTKKDCMRSVTIARTNGTAVLGSLQTAGAGIVLPQDRTPGGAVVPVVVPGKSIATSVEGVPAVSPVA